MRAGAASVVINNVLGSFVQGAGDPNQRVESIRDDLEANALYLATDNSEVLLVTCDLAGLESSRVRRYASAMASAAGINAESIIIGCSHTHAGPVVVRTNYRKPVDEDYSLRLESWLCALARQAVESADVVQIGWSLGRARLGYNRRVCYADGTHSMYRQAGRDADFSGVEGPEDTDCLALAVFNRKNDVKAILCHGTGHPGSYYGRHFLSAEYPGFARRLMRDAYGQVPVLFFNGSLGDIAMSQQTHRQATPDSAEVQVIRLGSVLAGETLRLIHEMQPASEMILHHQREEVVLPVRLPAPDVVEAGRAMLARIDSGEELRGLEVILAWGSVSLFEQFGNNPVDRIALHVLRIGDLAIATHPFELYCQYQLDLKRRSPVSSIAVLGLSDGYAGYLPTLAGALGGGYSGTPIAWCRFDPACGCKVVDHASQMLHALWKAS